MPLVAAQPVLQRFAGSWKQTIGDINLHVMGSFHNMKTGMEILKRCALRVPCSLLFSVPLRPDSSPSSSPSLASFRLLPTSVSDKPVWSAECSQALDAASLAACPPEPIRAPFADASFRHHHSTHTQSPTLRTLTQLLLYYTRLLDVLKKHCPEHGALAGDMVNIPSIIAEIKKYSRTF